MRPIFRRGDMDLRRYPVLSATVIEIGDLLFLNDVASADDVQPASGFTWDTNIATTQASFADVFVGVAYSPSAAGETDDISADVSTSIYEYDVPSATYSHGDTLGPDKDTGSALLSQTLEKAVAASSVARAIESPSDAVTRLKVQFASAYNTAANSAAGAIG